MKITATLTVFFLTLSLVMTATPHRFPVHRASGGARSTTEFLDSSKVWIWDSTAQAYTKQVNGSFYTYDQTGHLLTETNRQWTAGAWVDNYRETHTYDIYGNETGTQNQSWSGSAWVTSSEGILTYDQHNNITSAVQRGVNGGTYDTTDIATWTYGPGEVLTVYSTAFTVYGPSYDYQEVYVTNGDVDHPYSITDQQRINGNAWANILRRQYSYGGPGIDTILIQKYVNNAWVDSAQQFVSPTIELYQLRIAGSYWQNTSQALLTLDSHGNQIALQDQAWSNNAWVTDNRDSDSYTYDVSGHVLARRYLGLNVNTWYTVYIDSFTYDAAGNQTGNFRYNLSTGVNPNYDLKYSSYDSYQFITSLTEFSIDGSSIFAHDSTHYYYHTGTAVLPNGTTEAANDNSITLYPVPAHSMLHIAAHGDSRLSSAEVTDLTGRTLLTQEINATDTQININTLSPGIYHIAITTGDGRRVVKRIVVE